MYEQAALLGLYAETPLHPGTGQALGAVDLPVQRERHTNYPLVPGSSIKGVMRAAAEHRLGRNDQRVTAIFGPGNQQASDHAGALGFSDARLLLFPVRSLFGVFAWLTCPFALARFQRDAALVGLELPWTQGSPLAPARDSALVAPQSALVSDGQVVLEEFAFSAQVRQEVQAIGAFLAEQVLPMHAEYAEWRARLPRHLAILSDDDFGDFVRFATEVVARIALDDETKTTSGESGNLWYEEQVPSETVLYSLALASWPRRSVNGLQTAADILSTLEGMQLARLQIGGDETVGRGIVSLRLNRGPAGQGGGA